MKNILFSLTLLLSVLLTHAQQEDVEKLHANAKEFMRQGDYANASLILVRALEIDPNNIAIAKDLAFDYYLQKENKKALNIITEVINKGGDEQSYQIAGTIYQALRQPKDAEKLYKTAIKEYPESGPLYNAYGELLWKMGDYNAIKLWEKGIQADPSFGTNYFNASRYYYLSKDKIWSIIYGEIFINIESYTSRTAEIKNILLDSYKKLFSEIDLVANAEDKNKFEIAYLKTMNKQNSVVKRGLNAETLTMIRTRFMLDWNNEYAKKFPFKLFELHENLLELGLFPAYNQWIFGAAQNLTDYQNWMRTHPEEYEKFIKFQKGRVFKIPDNQYYHNR